jgi:hypothetical protein
VILRRGGCLMVVMALNRTLAGRAAGRLIRRPCRSGERGIKQDDRKQAGNGAKEARVVLLPNGHDDPNVVPSYAKERIPAASVLSWHRILT